MKQNLTGQERIETFRERARSLSESLVLAHEPAKLWPYLSNTDMINARSQLAPVQVLPGTENGQLLVETRDLGMKILYRELPYEWQSPQWLRVERVFLQGPVEYLSFEARFTPENGQTRATLTLSAVPRLPWMLLKPRMKQILGRLSKTYAALDRRLAGDLTLAAEAFGEAPALHRAEIERLSAKWRELSDEPAIVRAAAEYLYCAPDRYLRRMRPFELARRHGFDQAAVLRFFLRATRAGYLNLSWDLLCPGCQGAKGQSTSLAGLDPHVHCDACGIDYTGRFDENFELTFCPVQTLRPIHDAPFCAGSPANTAHLVLQQNFWPQQRRELPLQLEPGRYRCRASGLEGTLAFEVAPQGQKTHQIELVGELGADDPVVLAPDAVLTVLNRSGHFLSFKIENLAWREDRVSAALVSTMQDFRDMFGSEVLRPGVNLAVSNLAVMFTDLKDSTLMYDVKGDAHAFSLVQDHFEIMQELIRDAGGAIVKTIGDAVMAVFQDPLRALDCALMIQREFRQWNKEWYRDDADRRIIIKLGVHRGPCIALNLNERLDYFGSTINKAARIQNESIGEDVVISEEMLETEGVRELLADCEIERFEKNLKGLSGTAVLYRIKVGE
ncbi:MAG TPA: DUF5939 domain-containing protein [Candidatus Obscuribacterales bacterium]